MWEKRVSKLVALLLFLTTIVTHECNAKYLSITVKPYKSNKNINNLITKNNDFGGIDDDNGEPNDELDADDILTNIEIHEPAKVARAGGVNRRNKLKKTSEIEEKVENLDEKDEDIQEKDGLEERIEADEAKVDEAEADGKDTKVSPLISFFAKHFLKILSAVIIVGIAFLIIKAALKYNNIDIAQIQDIISKRFKKQEYDQTEGENSPLLTASV